MRSVQPLSRFFFLTLVFVATATAHAQARPTTFVPFQSFVTSVASADPKNYVDMAGARVESIDAFEEMRRHVVSLYAGVQATHSFLLAESQYVDCVPIMQQPSVRQLGLTQLATPPPPHQRPPSPDPALVSPSPLELGLKDSFGNSIACEDGTIPMVRLTLETLSRFRTLKEFFQKDPNDGASAPLGHWLLEPGLPGLRADQPPGDSRGLELELYERARRPASHLRRGMV